MNVFEQTNNIIERIFEQARNGKISIGQWIYWLKFNTVIEGKAGLPDEEHLTIKIPDYNLFVWKVARYMKKAVKFFIKEKQYFELDNQAYKDKLFMCLMLNLSVFDAENIYQYIDLRTKMLDTNFASSKFSLGKLSYTKGKENKIVKICASIKVNSSNLEGPYKMSFSFENKDGERFAVPSITFGIANKSAYVYAVQQSKEVQEGQLVKDLDRYFRKLNKGVNMDEIIANVSPNALVSLTLFSAYLKTLGISKIIAKDFLPIRYMAVVDGPRSNTERLEKLDKDQFNMTNKFMYLFLRYSHHFTSCPAQYDADKGEMTLTLNDGNIIDDNIIFSLDEAVLQSHERQMGL